MAASTKIAEDFLEFVDACPTPFHVVQRVTQRLLQSGFRELQESESWSTAVEPGGKHFVARNKSALIAFTVGNQWMPGKPIAMIAAHTDSPTLRIKPISKREAGGYLQVGVETYGGGLWHTWFDRDLSIAGKVILRTSDGKLESRLVKINRPLLRIPSLAVHIDRQKPFSFNKETHLIPFASLVTPELNSFSDDRKRELDANHSQDSQSIATRHNKQVLDIIAESAAVNVVEIVDFEMLLYDTQKAAIGGLNSDFIFSARLDNLAMSYCSIESLLTSITTSESLSTDESIRMTCLFDHEEIGSKTAQGADSNFLPSVIRRLCSLPSSRAQDTTTAFEQTLSKSFIISADMAHAIHPNHLDKHEAAHRPILNGGVVVKVNANARYATNSIGLVLLEEVARRAHIGENLETTRRLGIPLQRFVVRNDGSCSTTVGPIISTLLGVRTVDLGNPQLSMHSIRETCGVHDLVYASKLFESFFTHFIDISATLKGC